MLNMVFPHGNISGQGGKSVSGLRKCGVKKKNMLTAINISSHHERLTRLAVMSGQLDSAYYSIVSQDYRLFETFRNRQVPFIPQIYGEQQQSQDKRGLYPKPQDIQGLHPRQI